MSKEYLKNGDWYKKISCPVCDASYDEQREALMYDPPIGVCEHYYRCSNCGYNEYMAYSPTYYSFDKLTPRSAFARMKNIKKVLAVMKQENYVPAKDFANF